MKLKDARKAAINYCKENNCTHTYISYIEEGGFYLTEKESNHTVFFVNRNGSLDACLNTNFAVDFHKELKRRKNDRRKNSKKKMIDIFYYNHDYEIEMSD